MSLRQIVKPPESLNIKKQPGEAAYQKRLQVCATLSCCGPPGLPAANSERKPFVLYAVGQDWQFQSDTVLETKTDDLQIVGDFWDFVEDKLVKYFVSARFHGDGQKKAASLLLTDREDDLYLHLRMSFKVFPNGPSSPSPIARLGWINAFWKYK